MLDSTPTTRTLFLIEKAKNDLIQCKEALINRSFSASESRCEAVALLDKTIRSAEKKGYDDELAAVYEHINRLIQGWWFEDTLKLIIGRTYGEVIANHLQRKIASCSQLSEEKQILQASVKNLQDAQGVLQRSVTALESANTSLTQALAIKTQQLDTVTQILMNEKQKNQTLTEENAELKSENQRLRASSTRPGEEINSTQAPHFFKPQNNNAAPAL